MDDFEPATDLPERIDLDDTPVNSTARIRDEAVQKRRARLLILGLIALAAVLIAQGAGTIRSLVAVAAMYLLFRLGFAIVGSFARPVPEPPPPGELRKVKLVYRCPSCGAELRMTLANDQVPDAPRHCSDEMDLMTDINEL